MLAGAGGVEAVSNAGLPKHLQLAVLFMLQQPTTFLLTVVGYAQETLLLCTRTFVAMNCEVATRALRTTQPSSMVFTS